MQLRAVAPEIGGLYSVSLLQDGYTLQTPSPSLGSVTVADIAHVGADQAGRLLQAVVAAAKRGGARVVERRKQEALRHIHRVRVQCGYGADPSQEYLAGLTRF
jgi:hypothetical protein